MAKALNHTLCVAPMLDLTDRHCRYFHRLISRHALLYSEMITTGALLHGDRERLLGFNQEEHPLALQLGGSCVEDLVVCAKIAEDYGYDEVNLNVGCPSDRVQNGRFGACLMAEPQLVAECVAAMQDVVSIPVTVKCRIGIDNKDSFEELNHFVATVAAANCQTFIVHARKAWLSGLSPKQNREIPPLRYEMVHQLKAEYPQLSFILNGGITSLQQAAEEIGILDGIMIGREAYHNPYMLATADEWMNAGSPPAQTRHQIVLAIIPYIQQKLQIGCKLHNITRHMLGLFHGQPGARAWRRHISENACRPNADERIILQALALIQV